MKGRALSTSLLLLGSSFFAGSIAAAEFSDQAQVTSVRAVFGSAPQTRCWSMGAARSGPSHRLREGLPGERFSGVPDFAGATRSEALRAVASAASPLTNAFHARL